MDLTLILSQLVELVPYKIESIDSQSHSRPLALASSLDFAAPLRLRHLDFATPPRLRHLDSAYSHLASLVVNSAAPRPPRLGSAKGSASTLQRRAALGSSSTLRWRAALGSASTLWRRAALGSASTLRQRAAPQLAIDFAAPSLESPYVSNYLSIYVLSINLCVVVYDYLSIYV